MQLFHIYQDGSIFLEGKFELEISDQNNLRSSNVPGVYNFAIERIISHRFELNISIKSDKIVFDEINLEILLIEFLRNGGFDESETEHFVEDFLFRLNPKTSFNGKEISKKSSSHSPPRISFNNVKYDEIGPLKNPTNKTNLERNITIGVTIGNKELGKQFFLSLWSTFSESLEKISVIVCCYNLEKNEVGELLIEIDFPLNKVVIISQEWGIQKANQGDLGPWFLDGKNQSGVSFGRCVLHRALFEYSQNETILITDDDMLFNYLNIIEINNSIDMMLKNKKIIGIGNILGDAPLHPSYIIRTQSIDFFYSRFPSKKMSWNFEENDSSIHDLHHDLSTKRTDHLEVPLGLEKAHGIDLEKWSIFSGKSLTRPIHLEWRTIERIPTRGGNTLILERFPLVWWPNVAPRCGGIQFRRGDTIWSQLIEQSNPELICTIPLALEHSRIKSPDTFGKIDSVRGDILGSMFTRAMINQNLNSQSIIINSRLRESRLIMNLIRTEYLLNSLQYNEKSISELQLFTKKLTETPFPRDLESELTQFIGEMDDKVNNFRNLVKINI